MLSQNILRAVGVAGLTLATTFAAQATPSATWTVTTTGFIAEGYDFTGVFGVAGQDLTGLAYTQSITASVDPALWSSGYADSQVSYVDGQGPTFTDTVTVDGHRLTFVAVTNGWGEQYLSSAGTHEVDTDQNGDMANGDNLYAVQYAYSDSTPFVASASFEQWLMQSTANGSFAAFAEFAISGSHNAYFDATPSTISINAVPEAGMPAMLLSGLAMLAWMSRRKVARNA